MTDGGEGAAEFEELLRGLQDSPKRISSKYHYDETGSKLFEEITRLEEYYPTRRERALLEETMPDVVSAMCPATLVELGAGSAEKSRIILDAMVEAGCGQGFVPIDVSEDFLHETARALADEYPSLTITPIVGDIIAPIQLPDGLGSPRWIAFLGSTLGNFDEGDATALLSRVRSALGPADRFLLGIDLRPGQHKTKERIELAYNDAAGVTASFSVNLLQVVNDQFGSDFDTAGWTHRSVYSTERGRIETDVVATREQSVAFPDGTRIDVGAGEAIRTEISCKYDRETIDELFSAAGLRVDRWIEDEDAYYALVLGTPA